MKRFTSSRRMKKGSTEEAVGKTSAKGIREEKGRKGERVTREETTTVL